MYNLLVDILWVFLIADLFAAGVLLIVFMNARINLHRQISQTRFFFNVMSATNSHPTSYAAAEELGISIDQYTAYCKEKGIESPEEITDKKKVAAEEKRKQEERILQEEAAWRAEQERVQEERRRTQEEQTRDRRNRLKKFGFQ